MSDDKPPPPPTINGGGTTDADVNIDDHPDSAVIPKLRSKIELLEQDLINNKLKIKNLEDEISSYESDKRALTLIASKASELESQFSTLQHDLISSASEFESKERENVEKMSLIESDRNLLLEMLKESEEKMRELQTGKARQVEMLVEKLKNCEAKERERSDIISELEARDRRMMDKLSEEEAGVRNLEEKNREMENEFSYLASVFEAFQRKVEDELTDLEARDGETPDELSALEAIEREKSDKMSELEAREREKRIKLIH